MAAERILVVDDNPLNRRLAQVVLEKQQFVVRLAADGAQALDLVASFRPHLVLGPASFHSHRRSFKH